MNRKINGYSTSSLFAFTKMRQFFDLKTSGSFTTPSTRQFSIGDVCASSTTIRKRVWSDSSLIRAKSWSALSRSGPDREQFLMMRCSTVSSILLCLKSWKNVWSNLSYREIKYVCWGRNTFVQSIRPKLGLTLSTKGIIPHSDEILDYHSPSQY